MSSFETTPTQNPSSASSKKKKAPIVYLRYTDQTDGLPVIDPDKLFFTADTHFYCPKVLANRPCFPDIETMNETLIRNWNEVVPDDGVVSHLGDLSTHLQREIMVGLINSLHGTILFVKGTHDDISQIRNIGFREKTRLQVLGYSWTMWVDGIKILLNHYPYLCYEGEYDGVWQLFGHVHSGQSVKGFDTPRLDYLLPYQYDVGVDGNNYRPVSFRRLQGILGTKRCRK